MLGFSKKTTLLLVFLAVNGGADKKSFLRMQKRFFISRFRVF
jgi:hypothetical protein